MSADDDDDGSMSVRARWGNPASIAARESESALTLLEIASELGQPFGHEYSTKLGSGHISADRHLLTLPREAFGATPEHLLDLLSHQLGLPPAWRERLANDWQACSHIHLGCEAEARPGEPSMRTWKVYFESADTYGNSLRALASRWCRVHRAYKWRPLQPGAGIVSVYDALLEPGLTPRKNFINEVLAAQSGLREAVHDLLNRAQDRAASQELMLLRVTDENTARMSLDLNFYPAELTMGAVASELRGLADCCGVEPSDFNSWLDRFASLSLGHLAAGFGAGGQAFVTLYGGMQEWEA